MKTAPGIGLSDVQAVYEGPEGALWELIMGEQIHLGGFRSSMALAERAGIGAGMVGADFCCCTGAGMRFLMRFRDVERMLGVDATEKVVEVGRRRCEEEGLSERIEFVLADVCDSGLPDDGVDFIWGEDAWCYVTDKPKLISEAVRLTKPGGTIAFTDWIEGPSGMTDEDARRFLGFMKFPNLLNLQEYGNLLIGNGCEVVVSEDTDRFAPALDLYLEMLENQIAYDAMKIVGFDMDTMNTLAKEMRFAQELARSGRIAQGMFVARVS